MMNKKNEFRLGLKDGIPIALGYLSVSFSLGISMLAGGLTLLQGTFMSLSNVTSAGQFAGLQIIVAGGTIGEIVLTQLIINIRYALMSLSLSQKLSKEMTLWQRMMIAFANTDEIFAVAIGHQKELTFRYMFGLQILPILSWTIGTALGMVAANLLPASLGSALGIALYGMFIAIVVPQAKKSKSVCFVALLAILFSCIFYFIPCFQVISTGISIVISTLIASVIGAYFFPVKKQ